LVAIDNPISPREYVGKFWVDSATHDSKLFQYVLDMQGSSRVTLGTDYPFPLGDLEVGKFITEMNLDSSVIEDVFCNSTLEWLQLKKEDFLLS
jgi:aminocarboxymuconate-semialdehyde decarboxylase